MKKENGITLIALIITIIVLLILAGVSIAMVVGDNGVLGQAINATTATDIVDTKEQIELAVIGKLDDSGDYTVKDVLEVAKEITGNEVDVENKIVESAKGNTVDISDILEGATVVWCYATNSDGNTVVTNGSVTLAIGDFVNYDAGDEGTYTSLSSLNGYADQEFNTSSYVYGWRVLGADEDTGELLIISEDLIGPDSGGYEYYKATTGRTFFYLKYKAGYVNCESELNEICNIYGNGYGATGARSVTVEDINKITGYDPTNTGTGKAYGSGTIYEYGNEVTYTYNTSSQTDYSWSGGSGTSSYSFTYYTGTAWETLASGDSAAFANGLYRYYPDTLTTGSIGTTLGIEKSSTEYYLLFTNSSSGSYADGAGSTSRFRYWLAYQCSFTSQEYYFTYACMDIYDGRVDFAGLWSSTGSSNNRGWVRVRHKACGFYILGFFLKCR